MADVVKNSPPRLKASAEETAANASPPQSPEDTNSASVPPKSESSTTEDQPDRGRLVLMAYCTFFTLLLGGQYLWLYFDKPEPLQWDRDKAFESFRVDVNNATWVDWIQLPGIGQTTAERILSDIDRNGPFENIDDLTRIKGIGPKTLDRIRPWLTIRQKQSAQTAEETSRE